MKVVITGASKGIGYATSFELASLGAELFICAREEAGLIKLKETIEARYPSAKVHYQTCDVSNRDELNAFAEFCIKKANVIDVLINNAGVFIPGQLHNEPEGRLEQMIDTNLYSAYHLTRKLVPGMQKQKSGHIINICSIASDNAYSNGGAYSVSKFALYGFSKNLREELKEDNIRVTSILPGATYTASWEGVDLPEERFIDSEDVAKVITQAITLSSRSVIEDIVIRPQLGDL